MPSASICSQKAWPFAARQKFLTKPKRAGAGPHAVAEGICYVRRTKNLCEKFRARIILAIHMEQPHTPDASYPPAVQKKHPFVELLQFALIAILIVVPVRLFIAQPFVVSGASMQPTFENGQYLIIDQLSYRFDQPNRGDVIVFQYPYDTTKYFIKRIIALPGETINIDGSNVFIHNDEYPDGFQLDEPYVAHMSMAAPFSQTLNEEEYFVMGDNRDQSSDSRVWGVLENDRIVGRALLRLLPVTDAALLPGVHRSGP